MPLADRVLVSTQRIYVHPGGTQSGSSSGSLKKVVLRLEGRWGMLRGTLGQCFKTLSQVPVRNPTRVPRDPWFGTAAPMCKCTDKAMTAPLGQGLSGFSTYDIYDRAASARGEETTFLGCRAPPCGCQTLYVKAPGKTCSERNLAFNDGGRAAHSSLASESLAASLANPATPARG